MSFLLTYIDDSLEGIDRVYRLPPNRVRDLFVLERIIQISLHLVIQYQQQKSRIDNMIPNPYFHDTFSVSISSDSRLRCESENPKIPSDDIQESSMTTAD